MCASVVASWCVRVCVYMCMCVSTILNYVPVDVQQCLFEKALLESLVACVGEGAHMYSMHVLNYFCSYPVSICVFFHLLCSIHNTDSM